MPGNIQLSSPTLVFPNTLSTAFTETSVFPVLQNSLHDNSILRGLDVYTNTFPTDFDPSRARPMRRWSLSKRLGRNILNGVRDSTDQFQILRDLWVATHGGLYPLFFYPDPADYDPTGANETGQAVVVFSPAPWGQSLGPVMADVTGIELVEVA